METKNRKVVLVIAMAMLLFVIIIPGFISSGTARYRGNLEVTDYDEGWYRIEDGKKIPIQLPYKEEVEPFEKIKIYHDVTRKDWEHCIYYQSVNKWVLAYADHDLIYKRETYQTQKYKNAPTNGCNYIEIPKGTKTLCLVVASPYRHYGNNIGKMYYGEKADLVLYHQAVYQYNMFIDLLLVVIGGVVLGYANYLIAIKKRSRFMSNLGISIILMGFWMRVGLSGMDVYILTNQQRMICSYWLWFLLSIFACRIVKFYTKEHYRKYNVLERMFAADIVISVVLKRAGIFDYVETIWVMHALGIVLGLEIFWDQFVEIHKNKFARRNHGKLGVLILTFFCILEIIQYYRTGWFTGYFCRCGILVCFACIAIGEFYKMEKEKEIILKSKAEQRKRQLEVTLSQLQPHFIFNALGAIRIMIRTDANTAYDMLYDFSKFLRASLDALQQEEMIPFSVELEQIRAYLNIENKRFSNRIQAKYEIETENFKIPALTIEPLVVNAVRHGLRKGKDAGTVTIRTREISNSIMIEIQDDGVGFDMEEWQRTEENHSYMGISNVRSRLVRQTKAEFSMKSVVGEGTTVQIRIPYQNSGEWVLTAKEENFR